MDTVKINKMYKKIVDKNLEIIKYASNEKKFIQKEKEMLSLYEEIFDIIFEECKKNNIKNEEEFSTKFPNIYINLDNFIYEYVEQFYIVIEYDKSYSPKLIALLDKLINHFEFEDECALLYKLSLARGKYEIGSEKEVMKILEDCVKEYPKYSDVIDDGEGFDDLLNYDEEMFIDEYQKLKELEKKEYGTMIKDFLKEVFLDKVKKKKTYEQYLDEREPNYSKYTSLFCVDNKIQEEINSKEFLLENKQEIIKSILISLKEENFYVLKDLIKEKYKKVNISDTIEELSNNYVAYMSLVNLGIVFGEIRGNNVILHIPDDNIEILKSLLEDKSIQRKNKKINKIYTFIEGAIKTYGVIDIKSLAKIYSELFKKEEGDLATYLFRLSTNYNRMGIILDKNNKKIEYVFYNVLSEEEAIKIVKSNPNLNYYKYTFDFYKKINSKDYLKKLPSLKRFDKNIKDRYYIRLEMIFPEIYQILSEYVLIRQINKKSADKILDDMKNSRLKSESNNEEEEMFDVFFKSLLKLFNDVFGEIPNWKQRGRILKQANKNV